MLELRLIPGIEFSKRKLWYALRKLIKKSQSLLFIEGIKIVVLVCNLLLKCNKV